MRRTASASAACVQRSATTPGAASTSSATFSGVRAAEAKVCAAMLNGAGQGAKGPSS